LEFLADSTVLVSGYYVIFISAALEPTIIVLRT